MRKTGESYATARWQLAGGGAAPPGDSGEMVPFSRFTERAKRVLALAQVAAETEGSDEIRPAHLALGLLDERDGLAFQALVEAGVDVASLRDRLLKPPTGKVAVTVLPAPATKRVIEHAVAAAEGMGHSYVGTEHLLLALADGRHLKALGVPRKSLRDLVERMLVRGEPAANQWPPPRPRLLPSVIIAAETERARQVAAGDGSPVIEIEHLARSLAQPQSDLAKIFARHGLDLEGLQRALAWPDAVVVAAATFSAKRNEKEEAIAAQDFERAAALRQEERALRERYQLARTQWFTSLGGG